MRKVKRFLVAFICSYLLASCVLSVLVSIDVVYWPIVSHREPFLLVDVAVSTVLDYRQGGVPQGFDQHGNYIAYNPGVVPGQRALSIFVWNPFTNWCDDIVIRWDIAAW